ncbi:MAG: hypothetical protein BRD40_00840, partial [Bacteroidetes bacterium QS_1_65_9]
MKSERGSVDHFIAERPLVGKRARPTSQAKRERHLEGIFGAICFFHGEAHRSDGAVVRRPGSAPGGEHRVTGPPTNIPHINDVEPLPPDLADAYPLFDAGDLVVSVKRLHLVFVFDPDSMTVKWHASDPFVAQHDPDFIGDG